MTMFSDAVPPVLRRLVACRLTIRELEIIDGCADGLSNADIGEQLGLAAVTVKTHLMRISHKVGIGTRSGIVGYAYRQQLLVRVPAPEVPLTSRQRDLLPLVATGLENWEIAQKLDIAPDTVKTHLRAMSKALGCRTRAHMVRRAIDTGVLPLVAKGGDAS